MEIRLSCCSVTGVSQVLITNQGQLEASGWVIQAATAEAAPSPRKEAGSGTVILGEFSKDYLLVQPIGQGRTLQGGECNG